MHPLYPEARGALYDYRSNAFTHLHRHADKLMYRTVLSREDIHEFELVEVGNIPSARMNEEVERVGQLQKYYNVQPLNEAGEEEGRARKIAWFEK